MDENEAGGTGVLTCAPNRGNFILRSPSDEIFHLQGDQLVPMPSRSMREGLFFLKKKSK